MSTIILGKYIKFARELRDYIIECYVSISDALG